MESVWTNIDDRQRAYLQACYTIDQDLTRRNRAARTRGSLSPESDWLLYGPTLPASPLLHRLRLINLADAETVATFRSLELLGLLHCRYDHIPPRSVLLYVRLTPKGYYITRTGMGSSAPNRPNHQSLW